MSNTHAAPQFMGVRIKRREDPALITGQGKYTGDIQLDNMLYMAVLRSPYAHAKIGNIDTSAAENVEGVVAVLTAEEINSQMATPIPMIIESNPTYSTFEQIPRYALATDRVRHVGDPVAVVLAEDRYTAADALDLIMVDYDMLDAITDPQKALDSDAPLLHEGMESNLAFRWAGGNEVDEAFENADVVMELPILNQRLLPNAMEPRAYTATYDTESQRLTIWTSTQVPHAIKAHVAAMMGIDAENVRAIAPEVGGGFGAKSNIFCEEILVSLLSKQTGRPVSWIASRGEDMLTTSHGRDQVDVIRLAANAEGVLQAVDLKIIADCGAYYSSVMPGIPPLTGMMMTSVYNVPNARCQADGILTNKNINEPYRGAGRPEAVYMMERAMNVLAVEMEMDPIELRRKNFIPPEAFPYTTPTGATYDSGEYAKPLDKLLEEIDYPALRAEQEQRRQNGGKLLGIGLACYVEICGFGPWEAGDVIMDEQGKVTVLTGTSPHGQGHQTAWAQIAADTLQVPLEDVTVKHGDTDVVPRGIGTFGSRSAPVGGSAVMANSQSVRERALEIAAHLLEAPVGDKVLEAGNFHVTGTPGVSVNWQEVAAAAHSDKLPEALQGDLKSDTDFAPSGETYPFGAHACTVEIDPETGVVELTRYVSVDDCGRIINPLLVEGQVHGGIAQGAGQALLEGAIYDEFGTLVSGSFMDYTMPRADNFPLFETNRTETPSPLNPLGVKGIGEAATIGSTPTVANAVVDALAHLGVRHLDLPLTAEKVWSAMQE